MNRQLKSNQKQRNKLKHWLILASIGKPYTGGSTNTKVDHDLNAFKEANPLETTSCALNNHCDFENLILSDDTWDIFENQFPTMGSWLT